MTRLTSVISRICFIGSFLLASFAVWEKFANFGGLTLLRGYPASRVLAWSALGLIFVIALQLREIKLSLRIKGSE